MHILCHFGGIAPEEKGVTYRRFGEKSLTVCAEKEKAFAWNWRDRSRWDDETQVQGRNARFPLRVVKETGGPQPDSAVKCWNAARPD